MSDSPTGSGAIPPATAEVPGWPAANRAFAWLQKHQRGVLLGSVALQLVVLLGLTAFNAAPAMTGDTVMLRVVPLDPRDLLRGDYVILGYEFSRARPGQLPGFSRNGSSHGNQGKWENRTVYVSLVPEPDGEHWKADKFSFQRPSRGKFIRGQMTRYGRLTFGIEQYYVQEGTGPKYERAIRRQGGSARVAIDSGGRAKLRGLRIN